MKQEKVYIVTSHRSEDYHGTYVDVISVHATEKSARQAIKDLYENEPHYDTDYLFDTFNLIP